MVGLLQDAVNTLVLLGTAIGTIELSTDQPLLGDFELENTVASLRRKLEVASAIYIMRAGREPAPQTSAAAE